MTRQGQGAKARERVVGRGTTWKSDWWIRWSTVWRGPAWEGRTGTHRPSSCCLEGSGGQTQGHSRFGPASVTLGAVRSPLLCTLLGPVGCGCSTDQVSPLRSTVTLSSQGRLFPLQNPFVTVWNQGVGEHCPVIWPRGTGWRGGLCSPGGRGSWRQTGRFPSRPRRSS